MIGKTISHYKILEKLGGGGMGVVYKAEDTKLKRTVALKFLPPDLTRDDDAKERFLHEAQAASKFDHPNICTIHEIDETPEGQTFIAMAHLDGKTLKQRIAGGPVNFDEAIEIGTQILQGLNKAHAEGIIHRDIKPANLMVTNDGIVKILDFGLAKLTGATQLTKSGMTLGTVAYMSPEQTRGENVDERSDLWSLGVVLYEMLSGEPPFKGDYEQAIVYSIMSEEPEPITKEIATELQQIVGKALKKDREERYQSAEEMLADLQAFREGTKPAVAKGKRQPSARKRLFLYGGLATMLLVLVIAFFALQSSKPPTPDKIRLAVLPFDNITQSPDDEYFADGMTDEMIAKLSKIAGFGVIARTSVMQYKTAPKTVAEVGRELRVSKILAGSVRKAADQLRITVQLVDVATQEPIWSSEYDRRLADVFVIQSEVARQVAAALRVELSSAEKGEIERRGTENIEAYNLYLEGHYYAGKRTLAGLEKGLELFNKAIELDPHFAQAFAGLARCYDDLGHGAYLAPLEAFPKGKAAVLRALEIDPTLAEAHSALGYILLRFDWDWPGAEKAFKRAIELSPDYARTHHLYSIFLYSMGRFDEALSENTRAQMLDPLDVATRGQEGIVLYHARRYDEAIAQLRKTIAMDSTYHFAYDWLAACSLEKGRVEEAFDANQKAMRLGSSFAAGWRGYLLARVGRKLEAQKVLDQLLLVSQRRYLPPTMIALIYSELGEKNKTFEWLQKAYDQRDSQMPRIKVVPMLDKLHSDARFTILLQKLKLAD